MKYILGLLFFIIIFRLVSSMAWQYLARKARQNIRREAGDDPTYAEQPRKKKKISRDKGDYVDYEEVN